MRCFLAAVFLTLCAGTANAAAIMYDVDRTIGDGTVTGFIETDGTLGQLVTTNITDWAFTLYAPNLNNGEDVLIEFGAAVTGTMVIEGAAVTATETQLQFDFTKTGTNYILFLGFSSGAFWCLETTLCTDDGVDTSEDMGSKISGATQVLQSESYTGVLEPVVFATATAVPVPAAVWLFGSGLIGLVGFVRRKR